MQSLKTALVTTLCGAMFILCDSLAAYWGRSGIRAYLLIVCILAPAGYILFGIINQTKGLAVSSGLVNVLIVSGNTAVGIFLYNEQLTWRESAGLILGFLSLLLLYK